MRGPFPDGFDGPRQLPPAVKDRLAATLADAALVQRVAGIDVPRPVSPGLDARLEAVIVDRSTVLPGRFRRRLERTLIGDRRMPRLAVAAAVLLVLGLATLPVIVDDTADETPVAQDDGGPPNAERPPADRIEGREPGTSPVDQRPSGEDGGSGPTADAPAGPEPPSPSEAQDPPGPTPAVGGGPGAFPAPGSGGEGAEGTDDAGPEPPFAYDFAPPAASGPPSGAPSTRPPPPPLRIGVVGGGTAVEDGFRAYVELLNEHGGVHGRQFELVETSSTSPAPGVVAVVNVSASPVATSAGAPSWVQGPLLETPDTPEHRLSGRAFSFTSVLERQAHLAVLAAFPNGGAPGSRAAVYREDAPGPYRTRVVDAYRAALEAVGVLPVVVTTAPDDPFLVAADAAFLSLDTTAAGQFLTAAAGDGYEPPRGIWGVASLFNESLLDRIGPHVRVASPYVPALAEEMQVLRQRSGRPVATGSVHGWVTAKALAVAAYESRATSPAEMITALDDLVGWETSFIAPYDVRADTRSRTPEAAVLRSDGTRFVEERPFRRDPL